ncbi:MAG: ATP-dependent protease ATPase subunit HslU [Planctomycetota bacterium]|nr:MAG: ATP-dependent protease ATPase subunit HslU [Planctomycetota bacterium]
MQTLTPTEIVAALDRHIIGQPAAKRAVAIAVRNRWRRMQLPEAMREEICPSNILMIGPTGVGKTEIARRLAHLVNAPFIKVEATKYTEVGYHGRDVDAMIRDLLELAIRMVRTEQTEVVRVEAERLTEESLLDLLMPPADGDRDPDDATSDAAQRRHRNREKLRTQLKSGELEERPVELATESRVQPVGMFATFGGMDQVDPEVQNFLERLMPAQPKRKRMPIREARRILFDEHCDKLIDREKVTEMAIRRTEESGIVFIDEIDKLASVGATHGPDVSRQGVQRDLLPIIEGGTVATRHGPVNTHHILFIAAGAFSQSKPSDLMPELQGRLPIRVELSDLTEADFLRILTEPENALTKQQVALLSTEGVRVEFASEALKEIASIAFRVNQSLENIGARRLTTVMERLMEDLSFDAPQRGGATVRIDLGYVRERLSELAKDEGLKRFIL